MDYPRRRRTAVDWRRRVSRPRDTVQELKQTADVVESKPLRRPMGRALTLNGVARSSSLGACSPLRRNVFTTSFRPRCDFAISSRSLAATSSSMVRVVLMSEESWTCVHHDVDCNTSRCKANLVHAGCSGACANAWRTTCSRTSRRQWPARSWVGGGACVRPRTGRSRRRRCRGRSSAGSQASRYGPGCTTQGSHFGVMSGLAFTGTCTPLGR